MRGGGCRGNERRSMASRLQCLGYAGEAYCLRLDTLSLA
jgi:hypothetical protein